MLTVVYLMVMLAVALVAILIYWRFDSYAVFKFSLFALPLNYFVFDDPEKSLCFLTLGVSIFVVFVSGNYGKCVNRNFLVFWSLLVASMCLSSVFSVRNNQFWTTLAWLYTVLVVWLVLSPPSDKQRIKPITLVTSGALLAGLVSLALKFPLLGALIPNKERFYVMEWGSRRLAGVLGDYELLSELMVLGIVGLILSIDNYKPRLKFLVYFSIMFLTLVETGTRSGILVVPGVAIALFLSRRPITWSASFAVSVLPIAYILTSSLGTTLISRFSSLTSNNSISVLINRNRVWALFDSVRPSYQFLGYGPRFPWEEYGLFPHSIVKMFLYTGGFLGTFLASWIILYVLVFLFRSYFQTKSKEIIGYLLLVVLFLVNEQKVEFTRQNSYLIFISAFLACIVCAISFKGTKIVRENRIANHA